MSTVKLDRDAFRRGVENVMTFAPLREVVRTAGGVFAARTKDAKKNDDRRGPGSELRQNDGKSTRR